MYRATLLQRGPLLSQRTAARAHQQRKRANPASLGRLLDLPDHFDGHAVQTSLLEPACLAPKKGMGETGVAMHVRSLLGRQRA